MSIQEGLCFLPDHLAAILRPTGRAHDGHVRSPDNSKYPDFMNSDLLNQTFLSMTIVQWVTLLGIWIAASAAIAFVNWFLVRRFSTFAGHTKNVVDDYLAAVLKKTKWFFAAAIGLYAATYIVEVTDQMALIVSRVAFILLLIQVILWVNEAISEYINRYRERKLEEDAGAVTTVQAMGFLGRLVLYTVVLLLALDNFGVEVTALIASLGIGGIAVALTLQNVLGDLFASLSIVLDKPFVVGDFLIVGDFLGTVENIGLKTTRIRSLSGEQLVFSNSDLLGSRIRNYKRMYERRVVFEIGVTYQTPHEKLKAIPGMIRDIIESQNQTRFDRSHFKAFGDSALTFETVYYVLVPDFTAYMDIQQSINLALLEQFEQESIEFAYPTQTLHLEPIRATVTTNGA
jgi:small-conductance mechanosensitive channel